MSARRRGKVTIGVAKSKARNQELSGPGGYQGRDLKSVRCGLRAVLATALGEWGRTEAMPQLLWVTRWLKVRP